MTGFGTFSSKFHDMTGEAVWVSFELSEDGQLLTIIEKTVGYTEGPIDGMLQPAALDVKTTLKAERESPTMAQSYTHFAVDPETEEKTPLADEENYEAHSHVK